jgi:hypothetical protein
MTPQQYSEWTSYHADLLALRDPSDVRLFSIWSTMLMPFELKELREASLAIAADPSDKRRYRENHLSMLREAVFAKRAEASARERDRLDQMYSRAKCEDCDGVGLVRVPDPNWIVDGQQLERAVFLVVACPCPSGIARNNAVMSRLTENKAEHRLMDLAQYEGLVPDWRLIVQTRNEMQRIEFEAADLARKVDRVSPIDPALIKKDPEGGNR